MRYRHKGSSGAGVTRDRGTDMKRTIVVLGILALLVAALFAAPLMASAGGDQVNRPDGSGDYVDGQQSDGVLPDWAPRAQQTSAP